MDNWPWNILNQYCRDPTQRAWVSDQLRSSPIPNGQSPEDWLLARSMVAEGMTEVEAWSQVHTIRGNQQQNNNNNRNNSDFTQPQSQISAQSNEFYHQDPQQQGFGGQAEQSQSHAPYGFVSLQDVAPQVRQQPRVVNSVPVFNPSQPQIPTQVLPTYLQNITPQQLQHLQLQQRHFAQANAIAGPSISTHLLRPQSSQAPQQTQPLIYREQIQQHPLTIDLTSESPPDFQQIDPELLSVGTTRLTRNDSPIKLTPPGSAETPSPTPQHELSIRPAPGKKRSLVPVEAQPPELSSANSRAAKKIKSNSSSSIDPPVKVENRQPLPDVKPKINTASTSAVSVPIPAPVPTPTPAPAPEMTMRDIRPFLTPESLKIPKPVVLWKNLRKREKKGNTIPPLFQPTPKEVLEIVTAIRDHASDDYLRAMADDDRYCDVFSSWLLKALKDIHKWESTIVPIFQVLAKTDMQLDYIEDTRIRTRAEKVTNLAIHKDLASKAAIQSAFQRYEQYVVNVLIPQGRRSEPEEDDEKDSPNKKRKVEQSNDKSASISGTTKPASSKIPAPTTNGTKPPTSKAPTSSSNLLNKSGPGGKSATDMSFFGASSSSSTKPKAKLPEFKKKPIPPTSTTGPTSSASSLLANALQQLKAGPKIPLPLSGSKPGSPLNSNQVDDLKKEEDKKPRYNSKGKLIRNVKFKDDVKPEEGGGSLEQIKEFTQEAKEFEKFEWDDEEDVHGMSAHQLDVAEGAALASARGHPMIDWYEPSPFIEPTDPILTPEVEIQNDRERGILAKFHPPGMSIPDPNEDDIRIIDGTNPQRVMDPMNASGQILEYQSKGYYQNQNQIHNTIIPPQQSGSIGDLLKGLQNVIPPQQQHQQNQHQYDQYDQYDQYNNGSYGYNNPPLSHQQQQQPPYGSGWNNQQQAYGNDSSNGAGSGYNYSRNYDNYNNNNSRYNQPYRR
ncbi:uncharacterized protein L201_000601 [Kwoniella dendrophila CBS 6074]|uniref:TFIIS N-terminal domain-containing protein n=1 Tax=Kwoniella dendrophila CBS 6074 TaxID=1295534 RepID=A0AAX4JK40_9TREE